LSGEVGAMNRKIWHSLWLLLLYLMGVRDVAAAGPEAYAAERQRMVESQLKARDIIDPRVLAAMGAVPRHRFMPEYLAPLAYSDQPLPIGSGQTISQPYIVALMSQWAEVQPGHKVLEVGTGSGYQAAVLAHLTDRVFSIELRPELAEAAQKRLGELGYGGIKTRCGDGYQGWPEEAPFDAILVTATAPEAPPALIRQLKEGGRLVIPVGRAGAVQHLLRLRKVKGELREEERLPVLFVPLVKPEEVNK
jgi:protein-L-isoaspartate(D-aspartate) O-methyltransferase